METIEAKESGLQSRSTPNIGQVLERIVQSPSTDARKSTVFPSESVSASDFRIPKPGESRYKPQPKQVVAESKPAASEPKPAASEPKPAAENQTSLPAPEPKLQPKQKIDQPSPPVKQPASASVPAAKPAQIQPRTTAAQRTTVQNPKTQTKQKQVAKNQSSPQIRHKDAVKAVLLAKSDRSQSKGSNVASDLELEAFLRDAERTEECDVRCRPKTLELLQQIAIRTGCTPEDVATQAVACVAEAIQDSGFTFSLPMKAELKQSKQ